MQRKFYIPLLFTISVMLSFSGCGGSSGVKSIDHNESNETASSVVVTPRGIPNTYVVSGCIDADGDFVCDAPAVEVADIYKGVDLKALGDEARVMLQLLVPEAIGIGAYSTFEGKRYISLPAGEEDVSPLNMLAFGLFLYAQEVGEDWCGPCRMVAPNSYEEAKVLLAQEFKLTGTDKQNEAILEVFNYNLEQLGEHNLTLKQAYDADIKAMAESLINVTIKAPDNNAPDLSGLEVIKANGQIVGVDVTPDTMVKTPPRDQSSAYFLGLNQQDAVKIAYDIRSTKDKTTAHEMAFDALVCEDNEQKEVFMGGLPDLFSPTSSEPTTPQVSLSTLISSYPANMVQPYDFQASMTSPNFFAETLQNLPTDLTSGVLVLGFKEGQNPFTSQYNSIYSFGGSQFVDNANGLVSDIRNSWQNPAGVVYYQDLQQIIDVNSQSLLSKLQGGQHYLDLVMANLVTVDFVAVAMCRPQSKPDAVSVDGIPRRVQCDIAKDEDFREVIGGVADDFAQPMDPATPSASLQAMANRINYDVPVVKVGTLVDSLSLPTGSYISQASLLVNTRPSNNNAFNDNIYAGDATNLILAQRDPNDPSGIATLNGGTAHTINANEILYNGNSGLASGDLLTLLNSGVSALDVIVGHDTEVDVVSLQMCIIDDSIPCPEGDSDGDGVCDNEDCAPLNPRIWVGCENNITTDVNITLPESCRENVSIDLSPALSWRDSLGNPPTENNVFDGTQYAGIVWDGNMNWFDFNRASNTELSIDFCACGGGEVQIDAMKSDDRSWVYLDNEANGTIVSRTTNTQANMASWGSDVNGSMTFSATGSGVDHTLYFKVKNFVGNSGGAIDGRLNFIGHRGKCTEADEVNSSVDDLNDTTFDIGYEVINGDTLSVSHELLSDLTSMLDQLSWNYVGAVGFSTGIAYTPSFAMDDNGTPYVAFTDFSNPYKLTVMKFDGTQWIYVGQAGFTQDSAYHPSITIVNGVPYVVFLDAAQSQKLTTMRFDGTQWVTVGQAGFSANHGQHPDLLNDNGTLYVAYRDDSSNGVTVMQFDGTQWMTTGQAGFGNGDVRSPSLVIHNGQPHVAVIDTANNYNILVMRFDGTQWVSVGQVNSGNFASSPSLSSSQGILYLAYGDYTQNLKAVVKKYDGTQWTHVGQPAFSAGPVENIDLVVQGGMPYIAYEDYGNQGKTTVMKFDGMQWSALGHPAISALHSHDQQLLFSPANVPYVMFSSEGGSYNGHLSVMKYD
ncbi:MAG: hypothetical protein K0U47_06065 [Epsilonproteobacteria bacterium]|nr:hypothetical protein [Campylobacterota bacterium]